MERLCKCHGVPMDYRPGRGTYQCAERRRARQRAYWNRRYDEFVFRSEHMLKARRYNALRRRRLRHG